MTTGKPPQPLHKTLLGMPSDLQEALAKLRAENPTPKVQAESEATQSRESTEASRDLASTWYGNAYGTAAAPSAGPERSAWPNLPQSQAFEPPTVPTLPAGVDGSRRPSPANPTLLGLSSEVEAAFRELQVRTLADAAAPALRHEPQPGVELHGSRDRPIWPPPAEANPWAENRRVEPLPVALRRQPSAASAVPTRLGLASESAPFSQPAPRARTATPPPLKLPSSLEGTEPDREPSRAQRPAFGPSTPVPFDGGVTVAEFRDDSAPIRGASQYTQPIPVRTQTFASFETTPEPSAFAARSAPVETAWAAPPVATQRPVATPRTETSLRRWPALTLIGAAMIGFVVLVVVRAPELLPNFSARSTTSIGSATESPASLSPPSAASAPNADPRELTAEQRLELEKQATDLLTANDYAAARAIYQRLSIAEPTRADYARMLTFLAHKLDAACGGPGQAACAAAR